MASPFGGWSRAAALLVALLAVGCSGSAPPPVVVIVARGLRADRVGAYGYTRDTTPALDARARGGTVIEHARASRADATQAFEALLGEGSSSLVAVLRSAGYRSAAFVDAGDPTRDAEAPAPDLPDFGAFDEQSVVPRSELTDAALDWLGRGTADEPRFALVVRTDVLPPFAPPPHLRERFAATSAGFEDVRATGAAREIHRHGTGARPFGAADLAYLSDLYDAEVRALDNDLGRLYRGLPGALFVFTSDLGQPLGEGGRVGPGPSLGEEALSVPLVFFGADVPGRVRDAVPATPADLARTLGGWLGAERTEGLAGVPLLSGERPGQRVVRSLAANGDVVWFDGRWRAQRSGEAAATLLDLDELPALRRDLAVQRTDVLQRLEGATVDGPRPAER